MQSILQYRRFGAAVRDQLARRQALNDEQVPKDVKLAASDAELSEDVEKGPTLALAGVQTDDMESMHNDDHSDEKLEHPNLEKESFESTDVHNLPAHDNLHDLSRTATQVTLGTKLGQVLTGIEIRRRTTQEGGVPLPPLETDDTQHPKPNNIFVVSYQGPDDPLNPHNWKLARRLRATVLISLIAWVVGYGSAETSSVLDKAAQDFGVSKVVELLATGVYVMGAAVGGFAAGPLSETWGRNPIYIGTLSLFSIFVLGSALAPNIGAQLAFRFLAGVFGATPLTCAGGSLSDLWTPLERVFAFPIFAAMAFLPPGFSQAIGGWIAQSESLSWRWTEWITLIQAGVVLICVVLFQPETYGGILVKWKAQWLRRLTGDQRYQAPVEIQVETFWHKVKRTLYRPVVMTAQEPIIVCVALYLAVIFVVIFTFLAGYGFVFGQTYALSPGVTGLCFLGMNVGICIAAAVIPFFYRAFKRDLAAVQAQGGTKLDPEYRLWFAMLGGSLAIPVSLFWMGWTARPSVSIWSPLAASVVFGYGVLAIYISGYLYIIDVYEVSAASALSSITFLRFGIAGALTVVGLPLYENLGVHWALTLLGGLSALMVPFPYIAYKYGHRIRAMSRYAVSPVT